MLSYVLQLLNVALYIEISIVKLLCHEIQIMVIISDIFFLLCALEVNFRRKDKMFKKAPAQKTGKSPLMLKNKENN